jgi:(S)-2-hydroxy-acid oxidase
MDLITYEISKKYRIEGLLTVLTASLRENESAYDRYRIRPRILVNVAEIETSTEILGSKVG